MYIRAEFTRLNYRFIISLWRTHPWISMTRFFCVFWKNLAKNEEKPCHGNLRMSRKWGRSIQSKSNTTIYHLIYKLFFRFVSNYLPNDDYMTKKENLLLFNIFRTIFKIPRYLVLPTNTFSKYILGRWYNVIVTYKWAKIVKTWQN